MPADRDDEQQSFDETPQGYAKLWQIELDAATNYLKKFHERGKTVWKRFIDERESKTRSDRKLNLFHADTHIKHATLYGNTPQAQVDRRFADAQDDVARVGAEMLERIVNSDIERDSDTTAEALDNALWDWLVPGIGSVRLRYVNELKDVEDDRGQPVMGEDGEPQQYLMREDVDVDYVPWDKLLYSPGKVWADVRWMAFAADMTRAALVKRFGKIGKLVPLNAKRDRSEGGEKAHPWQRAEVWEIWSKDHKKVFWYVKGFDKVLDVQDDTLGLEGFFPSPRPLMANRTTDKLIPTPDFTIAQDLYDQIDALYERIGLLEDSVRMTGVYDRASPEIRKLLTVTGRNELVPADNWAMFAEKGGLKGMVDWFPVEHVAQAINLLTVKLTEKIGLLHQITGMADIMRGGASQSATATEQSIKAKFGSIRTQDKQKEFARFATDVAKLKAEIVAKHFDPQTIVKRSNMEFTPDAKANPQLIQGAIQFLKDKFSCYRIEIKGDQISMQDMAALKQERTEFIQALATFLTAMAPLAQALPGATPVALEIIRWSMASLKGSSQIEGVLDQAIAQATQMAQQAQQQAGQQKPDPKVQALQLKAQTDMAKAQVGLKQTAMKGQIEMAKIEATKQADLTRIDAERQAEVSKQAAEATFGAQEEMVKARIRAANQPQDASNEVMHPVFGRTPGNG